MTNPSKRIGSAAELAVLKYVRESLGFKAERLHLAGKNDEGDIAVDVGGGVVFVLEVKAERQISLAQYVTEAKREAENYARARGLDPESVFPLAVVKARNKGPAKWYAVTELQDFPW